MLWLPLLAKVRSMQARGGRNPFVNGAMRITSRGLSAALTTTPSIISLDAWWAYQAGAANGFLTSQLASFAGFTSRMRMGRNAGGNQTGLIAAATVAETVDSYRFQGKVCNLNFYAARGANFSAAGNALTVQLVTGTGVDQNGQALLNGTWTGQATPINTSIALTTGFVLYSMPVLIPSTVTQVGVALSYTPTGVAGADDSVYVTGVQLNEGALAAAFDTRDYGEDFIRCLRRLPHFRLDSPAQVSYAGLCTGAGSAIITLPFHVPARAIPTGVLVSSAGHFAVLTSGAGSAGAAASVTFTGAQRHSGSVSMSGMAGLTAGDATLLLPVSASATLSFTGAEL